MASTNDSGVFECRWGIMGCGGIAMKMTTDLLISPSTRQVTDVKHTIAAAASSTSLSKAQDFLNSAKAPSSAKAYDSYGKLVNDKDIDIIYIATPHSHHFPNAMLALTAGKHVVCEKPFTVNALQTKKLIEVAKEKGVFLMEAVWTRFFPLSTQIRNAVTSGRIGEVKRVVADLSTYWLADDWKDDKHRMVNMDLAGGALLDLGLYPLTWVFQILYHTQPEAKREKPIVSGSVVFKYRTGCDEDTTVICRFPNSVGIATTSMHLSGDPDGEGSAGPVVRIQGTLGEIQVAYPAYRPTKYKLIPKKGQDWKVEQVDCEQPGGGHGMFWQGDAAARCIRDGKLESDVMPLSESVAVMEVMDEVRGMAEVRYPEVIETTEYKA